MAAMTVDLFRLAATTWLTWALQSAPLAAQERAGNVERRVAVMGTILDVAVRLPRREDALAASEGALAEIRRVEDLLTTWRESPLARLNRTPAGRELPLEAELYGLLETVFAWSERTERAFDPTVLPLVQAWDLRGAGRLPSSRELAEAFAATGPDRFRLDAARRTATRLDARSGIDEGAWGKGYALERAARRLVESGARDALLDLGGKILALGTDTDGKPWAVTVAHPRERQRPVLVLALTNLSVSTSGNSERGREVTGRRIGHLLDPRTGQPATDFGSVTVVAPSALAADILSTAFFVLGPDQGLTHSAKLRREGVPNEVLFLIDRGGTLAAAASPGFSKLVISTDLTAVRGLPIAHH